MTDMQHKWNAPVIKGQAAIDVFENIHHDICIVQEGTGEQGEDALIYVSKENVPVLISALKKAIGAAQ